MAEKKKSGSKAGDTRGLEKKRIDEAQKKLERDIVENEAASQREAVLERVSEAHALPTLHNSPDILPSPVFVIDIEGMDVLASTAISSVGIIFMDASRASATELAEAVAKSAYASHVDRQRSGEPCEEACDGSYSEPCVMVCSWNFDVDAQIRRYARTVAKSTQAWWQNASPQAHAAASAPRYYRQSLADTLHGIRYFIQSRLSESLSGLSLEESEVVMKAVRFVVRGSQYDAAALETLFEQVMGIRPAADPVTAFSDTPDPDNGTTFSTLWFFRSVTEVRSYLDGHRTGLLAASGRPRLVEQHLKNAYKVAGNRRQAAAEMFAELVHGNEPKSVGHSLRVRQAALALRASGGRHVGEFDALYDALLILPTLNGTAARQFAEALLEADTE